MKINVNNKPFETCATSIASLAVELSLPETGTALAMDNRIVPREQWGETPLSENASIIIIKAMYGG